MQFLSQNGTSRIFQLVRVTGFEPAASWSQTTRATNCATPGYRCAPEGRGAKVCFQRCVTSNARVLYNIRFGLSIRKSRKAQKSVRIDRRRIVIYNNNIMLCKEAPAQNRDIQKKYLTNRFRYGIVLLPLKEGSFFVPCFLRQAMKKRLCRCVTEVPK